MRILQQNGVNYEYLFQLSHVQPNLNSFWIMLPSETVLPASLNHLRPWDEVEVRAKTRKEEVYLSAFEILNQPISWWTGQPGFETLLAAMKLKPISPMPIPNSDQIDKFFDADQRRAIAVTLDHRQSFVVIHGPSGSGKTLVAAEIINKVNNFDRKFINF